MLVPSFPFIVRIIWSVVRIVWAILVVFWFDIFNVGSVFPQSVSTGANIRHFVDRIET
jgi:hypothetical protein